MRLLYFHQHFSTPAGAVGTRSYELARMLIEQGHEVTMVCATSQLGRSSLETTPVRRGRRTGVVDGVRVIEFDLAYSNYAGLAQRAWIFLKYALQCIGVAWRTDYDVLFATSTPLTAAIPGIAAKLLRPRKPFIFEVRDLWPELPKAMGVVTNPVVLGAMSALEWLAYRAADACVGLSPGIVDGIRKRAPANREVVLVPNGCDLELFTPEKRKSLELPGIAPNDFVAIFAGAHGRANGLDAVLDAAGVLKFELRRADIKLLLIGDGALKPKLVARAQNEQLDNVVFADPVPKTRMAEILASADAGLMILANIPAFYRGTSPNKFFDYIASGVPVINNYPGWLADMISENEIGLAVPPESPEDFAHALVRLADNRKEASGMGHRARQFAEAQFSRSELAARWIALLEKHAEKR